MAIDGRVVYSRGMAEPLNYVSPGSARPTQLPLIGGALGMAGTFIGLGIFVLGCFGFGAAFYLAPLPMILGVVGLVLTLSGWCCKRIASEDSHVVAAIFVNLAVIAGALLELMIMMNKPFFAGAGGL
jgi:hypothetical protein